MKNLKKLTLLHSNDMHGDFLSEEIDNEIIGGVSRLSGYVDKVRHEEKNVIYAIAGDMFRGSVIDSEFKGLSTIEIMNLLSPDVVTIGNHEVDYGVAHLLFIEKCAKFPIINANFYIKNSMTRLFKPYEIIEIDGMKILFIGILTETVLNQTKCDKDIGTFLNINEAADEVGKICDAYNSIDIDFTVLLTHIGFDSDKELAKKLLPEWGVDVIIGGHSHTLIDKPEIVNDILIVQVGTGTDQIGRFDLTIDTDTNSIYDYTWKTIPVTEKNCPRDYELEELITTYKNIVDKKYGKILIRLNDLVTHPSRIEETSLGNLFSDILKDSLKVDLVLLGSGSIRGEKLGPIIKLSDLNEIYPYDGMMYMIELNGKQIRKAFKHIMRDKAFEGETEFYQLSNGMKIIYNKKTKEIEKLTLNNLKLKNDLKYKIALQAYHYDNLKEFLNLTYDEINILEKPKILTLSCRNIIEEKLTTGLYKKSKIEGRIVLKD